MGEEKDARRPWDGPWYELVMMDPRSIKIDDSYQRNSNIQRIRRMAKHFDPAKYGVPIVGMRKDGTLLVIDGQHRIQLAIRLDIDEIPCLVRLDTTREQEAVAFIAGNEGVAPSALERYFALLAAEDKDAQTLDTMLREIGLFVPRQHSGHSPDGSVSCVDRLLKLQTRIGAASLREVLLVMIDAWGRSAGAFHQDLVMGMARFWIAFGSACDKPHLIKCLQEQGAGPLRQRARSIQAVEQSGNHGTATILVRVIAECYNKRKRTGKLDLSQAYRGREAEE